MTISNIFPVEKWNFRSNSVFENLPEEDVSALMANATTHVYKKGQLIFHEGASPTGIYFVKKGKIKKYKTDKDGREQIFYVCNTGELLGYHALLCEERYPDSASTLEDSQITFIPKEDFLNAISQSPILSKRLLKALSHEFGVLVNGIASFAQKSVRERLALSLLILKGKFKSDVPKGKPVEIILSRNDLANIVGTAKETLVRLLHDFKEEGLIETEGKKIRILNPKKLVEIANFY